MTGDRKKPFLDDELLSRALRSLPRRLPPVGLTSSLRVTASRERNRIANRGIASRDRLRLFAHNLMRPLALPFAGGVFSTVVLFSMWLVPTYPVRGSIALDAPTMLTTEATVKRTGPVSASASGGEIIVDVMIDGQGRMVDYTIVSGHSHLSNEALRRNIENILIFTEFTPATAFGQPMSGKMRLQLGSSHIDVKG
jgi:hypothetical protein